MLNKVTANRDVIQKLWYSTSAGTHNRAWKYHPLTFGSNNIDVTLSSCWLWKMITFPICQIQIFFTCYGWINSQVSQRFCGYDRTWTLKCPSPKAMFPITTCLWSFYLIWDNNLHTRLSGRKEALFQQEWFCVVFKTGIEWFGASNYISVHLSGK